MYVYDVIDDDVHKCGITVTSIIWKHKDIHTKYVETVSWYIKGTAGSLSISLVPLNIVQKLTFDENIVVIWNLKCFHDPINNCSKMKVENLVSLFCLLITSFVNF